MKLYCLRHGHAEHNTNHLMNGDPSKEIHLTDTGKEQCEEAAKKLKDVEFDVAITSEFPRCKETLELVKPTENIPIIIDSLINDIKSGVEGQSNPIYLAEREKAAKEQNVDVWNARVGDGESFQDERDRISVFLDKLKKQSYGNVLLVAHYDTLQAIYGITNNLENDKLKEFKPKNCEIHIFELL